MGEVPAFGGQLHRSFAAKTAAQDDLGTDHSKSENALVALTVVSHTVASQKALPPRGVQIGLGVSAEGSHYLGIEIHKMSVVYSRTFLDAVRGMAHGTRCPIVHDMVPVLSEYDILAAAHQIELVLQVMAFIAQRIRVVDSWRVCNAREYSAGPWWKSVLLVLALQHMRPFRAMRPIRSRPP